MKGASLKERLLLLFLVVTGCLLRFYHLGFQSFWLDELHTAMEVDSGKSWADLWQTLKCCDQHPPVFFVITKLFISCFGSTEVAIRSVSAIAGTLGIWTMYLLGKEFYSAKLGLIAALFTGFNHFHIYYSQEARPYALVFLFTTLAFIFLMRLIKTPNRKNSLLYALFALLMMGTHYFGLFIFVAQLVTGLIFWIVEKEEKKKLFIHLLISAVVIGLIYSLWIPFLLSMTTIKSFWIQPPQESFAIDYFYEYFGNSDLLKPFILLFLFSGVLYIFKTFDKTEENIKRNNALTLFVICLLWIFVSFFIPYLRSLLIVPMLHPRYTIVILPAFIILMSFGLGVINKTISNFLLGIFILVSLTDIIVEKEFYKRVSKTQFREMAQFISSDFAEEFPVIVNSGVTSWHQHYYLNRFDYKGTLLDGTGEKNIDGLLAGLSGPNLSLGFWLIDAFNSPKKPSPELLKKIADSFIVVRSHDFHDGWTQLYVNKIATSNKYTVLDFKTFDPTQSFQMENDTVIAIWDKEAIADSVTLTKGKYKMNAELKGTSAKGVAPHVEFYVNNKRVGAYDISGDFASYNFDFETGSDLRAEVKVVMTNDGVSAEGKEDRNTFIKSILFIRSR